MNQMQTPETRCDIDISRITLVRVSTINEDFYLPDANGEYTVCIPSADPCNGLVRQLIDEWIMIGGDMENKNIYYSKYPPIIRCKSWVGVFGLPMI